MSELKPCPFCGGKATVIECKVRRYFQIEINATIQCTRCGANITKKWYESVVLRENECFLNNDTVYDLWNRRVDNG